MITITIQCAGPESAVALIRHASTEPCLKVLPPVGGSQPERDEFYATLFSELFGKDSSPKSPAGRPARQSRLRALPPGGAGCCLVCGEILKTGRGTATRRHQLCRKHSIRWCQARGKRGTWSAKDQDVWIANQKAKEAKLAAQ